jgi:hypothetical protein
MTTVERIVLLDKLRDGLCALALKLPDNEISHILDRLENDDAPSASINDILRYLSTYRRHQWQALTGSGLTGSGYYVCERCRLTKTAEVSSFCHYDSIARPWKETAPPHSR